jgi:hypothetical protein
MADFVHMLAGLGLPEWEVEEGFTISGRCMSFCDFVHNLKWIEVYLWDDLLLEVLSRIFC